MVDYNNPYFDDNVYGHVVRLLSNNLQPNEKMGVHLDVGCGFGAVAEPLTRILNLRYIGFDVDDVGIMSLRERGFQAHRIDLDDVAATESIIEALMAECRVSSISLIDVLEHVVNPDAVVKMLRRIAARHSCPLVVSVPNVAHRDVGFKLAFGRWDYTEAGLLDRTHFRGFTQLGLNEMLRTNGWHLVEALNVYVNHSDQHFPRFHPALAEGTVLREFLVKLRDGVDTTAQVYQFVGLYLPGSLVSSRCSPYGAQREAPFLSVVTRTQGKRIDTLRDVLLCLSAQTCQDFEVYIVGHKLDDLRRLAVERVIEDVHDDLRSRIRLIRVDDGNRTKPLNVGFECARGEYVAILDDDDVILGHWVESFKSLASERPGRVLRATCVAQTWEPVTTAFGKLSVRAISGMDSCYPSNFDIFQHLIQNETPPVSLAFPRAAFKDLGIWFDESLTTTEDWDFLMRTAGMCGVACESEITSIYRKWRGAESSLSMHSQEEWQANHAAIWRKLDSSPILLEAGATSRIRRLVDDCNRRHGEGSKLVFDSDVESSAYENALREQIYRVRQSISWKVGAPVRLGARLLGRRYPHPKLWEMNGLQLEHYLKAVHASLPMRFAGRIKSLMRLVLRRV